MLIIVIMLIYVSLEFQLPACMVIHNQCLNTELMSSVYFSNGTICSELFNQQIDVDNEMKISFEIDTIKNKFESILLFKLQRHSKSQSNIDTSNTEINKNKATHVHMIVAWKVKNARIFAYVALVEYAKEFTWNEDKLKKLYYKNHGRFKEYNDIISDT
jgi:hypothetical protein